MSSKDGDPAFSKEKATKIQKVFASRMTSSMASRTASQCPELSPKSCSMIVSLIVNTNVQ